MIRTLKREDLNDVMQIWLGANLQAHSFISKGYWIEHFDSVREMISQAEVYVYENVRTHTIEGFIGLEENDIAGIFVTESVQSIGIGKQLLDYVKLIKQSLCLRVYRKNERAVAFYRREGFVIRGQSVDADTGEEEFLMVWVNAQNRNSFRYRFLVWSLTENQYRNFCRNFCCSGMIVSALADSVVHYYVVTPKTL